MRLSKGYKYLLGVSLAALLFVIPTAPCLAQTPSFAEISKAAEQGNVEAQNNPVPPLPSIPSFKGVNLAPQGDTKQTPIPSGVVTTGDPAAPSGSTALPRTTPFVMPLIPEDITNNNIDPVTNQPINSQFPGNYDPKTAQPLSRGTGDSGVLSSQPTQAPKAREGENADSPDKSSQSPGMRVFVSALILGVVSYFRRRASK
jgi:hypothetical protein